MQQLLCKRIFTFYSEVIRCNATLVMHQAQGKKKNIEEKYGHEDKDQQSAGDPAEWWPVCEKKSWKNCEIYFVQKIYSNNVLHYFSIYEFSVALPVAKRLHY